MPAYAEREATVAQVYQALEESRAELEDFRKRYDSFYERFPLQSWLSFMPLVRNQERIPSRATAWTKNSDIKKYNEWFSFVEFAKILEMCIQKNLVPPMPPDVVTKKEIHAALYCELEELPLFIGENSGRSLIAQWRLQEGQ